MEKFSYKVKTANIIAVISVVCVFILTFVLLFCEVPNNNRELMSYLVGTITGTLIGGVVSYLFNYSKKNESSS